MAHYDEQREAELSMRQEQDISVAVNAQDSLFNRIFKKLNGLDERIKRLEDDKTKNDTE